MNKELFDLSIKYFTYIINYIIDQEKYDDYNKAKELLYNIFSLKITISTIIDQINNNNCKEIINKAYESAIKNLSITDISKIEKYKDIISMNNADLYGYLYDDSTTKYSKKYFYVYDENLSNEMTIEDYLYYYSFPDNEKMSDEQFIIKNTIEEIFYYLDTYLDRFYFEVFLYCFYQTDPDYFELRSRITEILIYESKITGIINRYISDNNEIYSLSSEYANKINDDCFAKSLEFFHNEINDDIVKKYERYKIVINDCPCVYTLLRDDAYTDDAKRYFGLDIKEEE